MGLSSKKTVVLKHGHMEFQYSLNGTVLPCLDSTRELDECQSRFHRSHRNVVRSASVLLHALFRCFVVLSAQFYLRLFRSLVVTKFLYSAPIWNPSLGLLRRLIENVLEGFLKRLCLKCGQLTDNIDLPPICELMLALIVSIIDIVSIVLPKISKT